MGICFFFCGREGGLYLLQDDADDDDDVVVLVTDNYKMVLGFWQQKLWPTIYYTF